MFENIKYIKEQEKRIEDESGRKVAILYGFNLWKNYQYKVENEFYKMILEMTGHTEEELRRTQFYHANNVNIGEWVINTPNTDGYY